MVTNDPDVPKLRAALKNLQAGVAAGAFDAASANEVLGKIADGLIEQRKIAIAKARTK